MLEEISDALWNTHGDEMADIISDYLNEPSPDETFFQPDEQLSEQKDAALKTDS